MKNIKCIAKERKYLKVFFLFLIVLTGFYSCLAFGDSTQTLSGIAGNVLASFKPMAKLITGGSFLMGLGFALGAILGFKKHKDMPHQHPVGTPIALLFVAVALLFLPVIFGGAGKEFVGGNATGISGTYII